MVSKRSECMDRQGAPHDNGPSGPSICSRSSPNGMLRLMLLLRLILNWYTSSRQASETSGTSAGAGQGARQVNGLKDLGARTVPFANRCPLMQAWPHRS